MAEEDNTKALHETVVELRVVVASLTAAVALLTSNYGSIADKMDDTYARKDVVEPQIASLQKSREWVAYLVGGAIILALLGLVLTGGGGKL